MRMTRLTDEDRHLGDFITYARCSPSWSPLRLVYSSGAIEDGAGPENFDADVGRKIARANAVNKVWPLMGYELRSKLSDAARKDACELACEG